MHYVVSGVIEVIISEHTYEVPDIIYKKVLIHFYLVQDLVHYYVVYYGCQIEITGYVVLVIY